MKNYNAKSLIVILLIAGLFFVNQPLEGQIVFGQPPAGDAKFIYQSWTIEDSAAQQTKLSQWVIPFIAFIPVKDNFEVIVTSSTAGSSIDFENGTNLNLSGLNDTRISVYTSFLDDRLMLGVGLNLPTGKKALNNEEVGITNYLTEAFLNFPVKSYGEGLGVNLEAGYARTVEIYSFGIGAGYILKSSFEPLDGTDDYKPGNQLRLGGYGSFEKEQLSGLFSLVFFTFSKDELKGQPVFKDGNMVDVKLQFNFVQGNVFTTVGLREIIRSKDDRIVDGELKTELEKSHGSETRVYLQTQLMMSDDFSLKGLIDYKRISANGYDDSSLRSFGSSNYIGLGFGGRGAFTEIIDGYANFEYFTGSADDGDLDLTGWQIVFGVGAIF